MQKQHSSSLDIAIIGMAALFPGSGTLGHYWQNILAGHYHIKDAPREWVGPYFDPTSQELERIYTQKVGLLGDLAQFNPLEFGILPSAVPAGDPDHFIALKLARDALRDGGYEKCHPQKSGIILGHGATPNRGSINALQHGLVLEQTLAILHQLQPELDFAHLRQTLKESLLNFPVEATPGVMSHMLTARIANRLDLQGTNFTVDAACASSLIAVELACQELTSYRADLMLAGGVQVPMPAQVYMLFCYINALSATGLKPFDQTADGTTLSEGCGILALKRLSDAVRDGDRIYAVLKGMGTASDGRALGLLTPRFEGQVLALERAYTQAGLSPHSVTLVEAHGTGIPVGDQTEMRSLHQVYQGRPSDSPPCAIGSVKSMIGHAIPASGAASLIKTALALHYKILPPTRCHRVDPTLGLSAQPFYVNTQPRPWIQGQGLRRAGVNAFGFGGINAHAILEEHPSTGTLPKPDTLLLFSGADGQSLTHLVQQVLTWLDAGTSLAEIVITLAQAPKEHCRLAVRVPYCMEGTCQRLRQVLQALQNNTSLPRGTASGLWSGPPAPLALMFPDHTSAYPTMASQLTLLFPMLRAWFDRMDQIALVSTRVFPPTQTHRPTLTPAFAYLGTVALSLGMGELLRAFGVESPAMVGYGTGQSTALMITKKLDPAQVLAWCQETFTTPHPHPSKTDFLEAVAALQAQGIKTFIEVGPGQTLTRLVPGFATDCGGYRGLLDLLGQLFIRGIALDLSPVLPKLPPVVYPSQPQLDLSLPKLQMHTVLRSTGPITL